MVRTFTLTPFLTRLSSLSKCQTSPFWCSKVMGQILPGVPVWSMANDSRWPGLPLVVFPGNVGGKEALSEAMIKVIYGLHWRDFGEEGTINDVVAWGRGVVAPIAPTEFSDPQRLHVQIKL